MEGRARNMNKFKVIALIFTAIAILLSDVMCADVAFNYSNMLWGIRYAGYSAPANAAFLLAVPYIIVILICIIFSVAFRKKSKR